MAYDFKPFEKKIKEYRGAVRAGAWQRAHRARGAGGCSTGVYVESYGARMTIAQVASVSSEDARTLRITPYDSSQAKEIEKAIMLANLGLSVGADERGVRVILPRADGRAEGGFDEAGQRKARGNTHPLARRARRGVERYTKAGEGRGL